LVVVVVDVPPHEARSSTKADNAETSQIAFLDTIPS
jgi:hypothetical protein